MLRVVIGAKRRTKTAFSSTANEISSENSSNDEDEGISSLEPWPEFLTRTARLAEEKLEEAGQKEWLDIWRRRHWRWAHKLIQEQRHKWAAQTLMSTVAYLAQRRPTPQQTQEKMGGRLLPAFQGSGSDHGVAERCQEPWRHMAGDGGQIRQMV